MPAFAENQTLKQPSTPVKPIILQMPSQDEETKMEPRESTAPSLIEFCRQHTCKPNLAMPAFAENQDPKQSSTPVQPIIVQMPSQDEETKMEPRESTAPSLIEFCRQHTCKPNNEG